MTVMSNVLHYELLQCTDRNSCVRKKQVSYLTCQLQRMCLC